MVEATHEEQFMLWQRHAKPGNTDAVGLPWREDGLSKITCIGVVDGLPLCVCWTFAVVAGMVVCFYETTSLAQDDKQVRAWADAICKRRVASVADFAVGVMSLSHFPSAHGYEQAREQLRDRMHAEHEAKVAADRARRAAMTRYPEVLALIERGIPEISDVHLFHRAGTVSPLVVRDGQLWHVPAVTDVAAMRGQSFAWSENMTEQANGLVPAKTVPTLHTFGYYGLFKPSIAEVLAQAPDDLHHYVAFSVKGPEDAVEMSLYPEATNAGYHVAATTYYKRA